MTTQETMEEIKKLCTAYGIELKFSGPGDSYTNYLGVIDIRPPVTLEAILVTIKDYIERAGDVLLLRAYMKTPDSSIKLDKLDEANYNVTKLYAGPEGAKGQSRLD